MLAKKNGVVVLDNLNAYYDARIKEENIKISFHEAARPGVRYSIKDPFLPNKVNVIGTLNILKASLDSNVKKVITASSSSLYGKVKYLPKESGFLWVRKGG